MKTDWHCKLPPKTKVHTGRGESFAPFKSAISIQNEDAMTFFWKCCPCSESFAATEPDLRRLSERFKLLGCQPKATCVNNCCTVRGKLQAIFPGMLVKLDTFHWIECWDDLLFDEESAKSETFRGMLRQMLFEVEHSECQRVRCHPVSKGNQNPTAQEINKHTKATIPAADTLMRRMESLLRHVFFVDSCMDINEPSADDNRQRFFKPVAPHLRRKLEAQKKHVANGCLSDPSFRETGIGMHRANPMTFAARTARSTGTNENDNVQIPRVLNNPMVGIDRADRVCMHACQLPSSAH